jgi:hypothetical protein
MSQFETKCEFIPIGLYNRNWLRGRVKNGCGVNSLFIAIKMLCFLI